MLAVLVALLPVTALLLALFLLDGFKLVPRLMLLRALAAGAAAALAALVLHAWLFGSCEHELRLLLRAGLPASRT